jgi:two-component system chemotaxis sensor kinase CheA
MDNPPEPAIPQSPPLDEERRKALEGYMPDFLAELDDQIEALEGAAARLDKNPSDPAEINGVFRQIHTLKGTANALGFLALGFLCHQAESALAIHRESKTSFSQKLLALLFEFNDALRRYKTSISATWTDSEVNIIHLAAKLESAAAPPSLIPSPAAPSARRAAEDAAPASVTALSEKIGAIRVDVERLDSMMNAVGELSLLRNRSLKLGYDVVSEGGSGPLAEGFHQLAAELDSVTRRLHSSVMRARMLPVGNVFNKFIRVTRDLSSILGKEVDLSITGAETELDKNLLEAASGPLMHIIRNCIGHGIEPPDARMARGKPRRGVIGLGARQERNSIVIEVHDDGNGIDRAAIVEKALARGSISPEKAASMSSAETLDLIFLPGVSTASTVTDVSGRGVGMDVVRTNIEKLNGSVEISSEPGSGTRIRFRLPLTLAVMPTLLCQAGGTKLGFPLLSVEETARIDHSQIESIPGGNAVMLRDEMLPLLSAIEILKLNPGGVERREDIGVVVVRAASRRFGFMVDKILGHEDILLKPLDSLRGIFEPPYLTGATITGDGSVAFIVDVFKSASAVKSIPSGGENKAKSQKPAEPEDLVLVFGGPETGFFGVAARWIGGVASAVDSRIAFHEGREAALLDGGRLPVLRIGGPGANGHQYLIIFRKDGREAGLLARELAGLYKIPQRAMTAGGKAAESGGGSFMVLDPEMVIDSVLAGRGLEV